jgi:hypothetical protein
MPVMSFPDRDRELSEEQLFERAKSENPLLKTFFTSHKNFAVWERAVREQVGSFCTLLLEKKGVDEISLLRSQFRDDYVSEVGKGSDRVSEGQLNVLSFAIMQMGYEVTDGDTISACIMPITKKVSRIVGAEEQEELKGIEHYVRRTLASGINHRVIYPELKSRIQHPSADSEKRFWEESLGTPLIDIYKRD